MIVVKSACNGVSSPPSLVPHGHTCTLYLGRRQKMVAPVDIFMRGVGGEGK